MSSTNGFNIFERSIRGDPASNPGPESSAIPVPSATAGANTRRNVSPRSSAAVLDSAVDESPTDRNDDPSTRLLGCPFPQYSSVGITVPANGQSVGPVEVREHVVDEYRATGWRAFLDCYKNTVITFRNSQYIHILHFLFCHIPISAIIIGSLLSNDCPQSKYLPHFVAALGFFGLVFLGLWIAFCCCEYRGMPCSYVKKFALGLLVLLLIGVAVEMYLICHLSPSFEPSAPDYCSKTFYYWAIYRETATAGALIIAAMVYIPASSLYAWCRNCSAPSPAGAFFHSS